MKKTVKLSLITLLPFFGFSQSQDNGRVIKVPVIFHVIYSATQHEGRTDGGNMS
ncbi:MAG: hypothetical protein H7320_09670 [Ferruginibacter sp.]|nr:hypothetical protein [Ferruginibacter sp.]